MSNGQNNAGPSQDLVLQFSSLFGRDRMVNGDQLSSILDQVSRARMVLDNIEREAHNRHAAYQGTVQQLEARVQQGAEAQQLLRRLGVQAQHSVPLINGPSVNQSPRVDGSYFQQPQPQQVPYQAAAATATGHAYAAAPSTAQQQSYQPNSYAAQSRQYAPYPQQQQAPQPISQHYLNYGTQQQPPPPPRQAVPQTQTYAHTSVPTTTPINSPFYQSTGHIRQHAPVQHRASAASPPILRTQHAPPAQRQSQSPQVSTPPAPTPAFPPLDSHSASNRPTVLVGNAQPSPVATSSSPPVVVSQNAQSSRVPLIHASPEQLTGITMKIYDLLKPQNREVLESVLKLVMKEMHSRGQMILSDRDVQQVYAWQRMPHIASEVTPLVDAIVHSLSPLHAEQATSLFKVVIQSVNRSHPVANANVQQLAPRPEASPASSYVPHVSNGPTINYQETPRPTIPPTSIPQTSLDSNNPSAISRPNSAQNPPSNAPPVPGPPMVNGSNGPHIQTGAPFPTTTINGHVSSDHPEDSPIRPAHTVLRMVPLAQGSPPSTPSAKGPNIVLTPNTKTLARDILRSLGRPSSSFSPSSQGSPTPSRPQQEPTAPPPRQASPPKVLAPTVSASDLQYREKEIIVIDDDSSVSSPAAPMDDLSGNEQPLPTNPVETSLPQPPSPPHVPSSPTLPYPPVQQPVVESPQPPRHDVVDHEVEEIQTPGVIQMAYEEVQEILQGQPTMEPPSNPLDIAVGTSATILPVPVSLSSPLLSSAASPPPRSRSSMSVEPVPADEPPVAGPSREPLFLASSPVSSSVDVETQMVLERDASESTNGFAPNGLLFGSTLNKGKGRALDSDSDEVGAFESPHRPVKRQKVEHVEDDDETEVEVIDTSEPEERLYLTPPRRGWEVYVDVPPLSHQDRHVIDLSTIPSKPDRVRPLVALSSSASSNSGVEIIEDDEIEESDGGRQERLDEEREAVNLSLSRLREMRCQWRGCGAVLNSGERLAGHLRLHASEKHQTPFICDWEGCSRRFAKATQFTEHCSHHSEAQLFCAFANCSVIALTPLELGRHQQPRNHRTQLLKPEVSIFRPQLGQLPPLPPTLPAYKSVPLRVSPARIPHDKHIWIGSKIAANITCYVHPGTRANHDVAAPSRTSRRLAEKVAEIERRAQEAGLDPTQAILHMSHGEYDAWLPYSSQRGPRYCDDLPSSAVTSMVERGLVIGAEYLEGDRRFPLPEEEDEEEEEDQLEEDWNEEDGLEEAHEVGNESDRTIVMDELPQQVVVPSLKENALPDVIMADEQGPENEADDEEDRIEVLQPSLGVSTPTSHGDQQNVDKEDDAYGAGSDAEDMSQPGWNFLRKDSEDVDGML